MTMLQIYVFTELFHLQGSTGVTNPDHEGLCKPLLGCSHSGQQGISGSVPLVPKSWCLAGCIGRCLWRTWFCQSQESSAGFWSTSKCLSYTGAGAAGVSVLSHNSSSRAFSLQEAGKPAPFFNPKQREKKANAHFLLCFVVYVLLYRQVKTRI